MEAGAAGALAAIGKAVSAAAAVGGLAHGVVQGERSRKRASRSQRAQDSAQRDAEARASSAQREQRQRQRRADRQPVDTSTLLDQSRTQSETMLSGAGGVDPGGLIIGRSTLLGQ